MKPILDFLRNLLIVILWTVSIGLIVSMYSHIYLAGKISEYQVISQQICCPTSIEGYIINKEMAIHYNGWLAFWKQIDKLPVGDYFVPDGIKKLEPIFILPPVTLHLSSEEHKRLEKELLRNRDVTYELLHQVSCLKRRVKKLSGE